MKLSRCAACALSAILSLTCSRPPETLASFGSTTLTLADLDAYLLAQPETQRRIPPGMTPAQWMEDKLRRLALERVLEESPDMARMSSGPEAEARRQWLRSSALVSTLMRQLTHQAEPTPEEVATRADALATQARDEPLLNFQHVYFRLDSAKTPRQQKQIRERAKAVAAKALTDTDFAALAREYSDSADAADGGLVVNVRPSDLEEAGRLALAKLAEDEVSGVVKTRTGLHVFRLLRRLTPEPPTPSQLATSARKALLQTGVPAQRQELLSKLGETVETRIDETQWTIGRWTLDAEVIEALLPDEASEADRQHLVERFLLAEEAIQRGLATPELEADLDRRWRATLLEGILRQRRRGVIDEIDTERLEPFYDAQPSLFDETEKVHVELIFVPQGVDSFATQQAVETYVAKLRAGASFAELARRVSQGPAAAEGGDLGHLESNRWQRLGPAVGAAVSTLDVGEVSDPIYCTDRVLSQDPWLLRGGFAVLRIKERLPERPRTFEEAIDDVRRAFVFDHQEELDREIRTRILEAAGFEIQRLPDPAELVR